MPKIVYNKERSGKILARGGPRDVQTRQRLDQQERLLREMVANDREVRPQMTGPVVSDKPVQAQLDLSQYMPLEEVRQKLLEAVEVTRKDEAARFESGLNSLNEQLKDSRKKYNAAQEDLINFKAEIRKLKEEVLSAPNAVEFQKSISEKDQSIQNLSVELASVKAELAAKIDLYESTIRGKDEQISDLRSNTETLNSVIESRTGEMQDLREKLDQVYDRISNGSIKPLVGSHMDRPALEDKIFIDPIEPGREEQMDSHIEVKEEKPAEESNGRNIKGDLAKLRELLKL